MGNRTFRTWTAALAVFAAVAVGVERADAAEMTAQQKQAVEKVVREYLLNNPEVIVDAMRRLEARQAEAERREARKALAENRRQIERHPASPVSGNRSGDVTLVEFFDYRCGVCRRVHPILLQLLREDRNVRRVFKEWPILSSVSVFAARAALASRYQDKYVPFHNAMMETHRKLDRETVLAIAARVGLDREKLIRDMEKPEIEAELKRNFELADRLRLKGTPSFVIGDTLLHGGRDLQTMKHLVAETRQKNRKKKR